MKQILTKNAAKCLKCNDVIESKHRHDFRGCKCGAIFVDGGKEYTRRGWDGQKGKYEELILEMNEFRDETFEEHKESCCESELCWKSSSDNEGEPK